MQSCQVSRFRRETPNFPSFSRFPDFTQNSPAFTDFSFIPPDFSISYNEKIRKDAFSRSERGKSRFAS